MDLLPRSSAFSGKHSFLEQTPCVTFDQPLYAIAKNIQWNWPATYGEDKCVIMLGAMHIEMAAWKCLGHWLEGSGWTSVVSQADLVTSGVAESLLKASHLTRTRHVHQVSIILLFCALTDVTVYIMFILQL